MKLSKYLAFACLLSLGASPVFAQDQSMGSMPGMTMQNMKGMHMMPATVTTVDATTGLTEVDAGGMKLRLHFPPTSLADVKAGDKITLHLAFTKP